MLAGSECYLINMQNLQELYVNKHAELKCQQSCEIKLSQEGSWFLTDKRLTLSLPVHLSLKLHHGKIKYLAFLYFSQVITLASKKHPLISSCIWPMSTFISLCCLVSRLKWTDRRHLSKETDEICVKKNANKRSNYVNPSASLLKFRSFQALHPSILTNKWNVPNRCKPWVFHKTMSDEDEIAK